MNATEYILTDVADLAVTFNVYRDTSERAYDGGSSLSQVDTVDVRIFAPTSSSSVVTEGSGQETSYTGLLVPSTDANGDLVHHVEVNDELRLASDESRRYDVRVKEGIPNDLDPDIWRLGLDRANSSE